MKGLGTGSAILKKCLGIRLKIIKMRLLRRPARAELLAMTGLTLSFIGAINPLPRGYMTVDLMRYLDKWMGIPLCFIFSVMNRMLRPFASKKAPEQIKKILIVQLSERGAVILAHSAVVKVKELFPQAALYYAIFEEMKESIQLLQTVPDDHILTVRSQSLAGFIVSTVKMIGAVRKEKMDVVIDFELFSRISALLSYLTGARIRVGFNKFYMEGLYRGTLQTHRVLYNHLKHISLNFLSLAYALREDPGTIPLSKVAVQTGGYSGARNSFRTGCPKEDAAKTTACLPRDNP